MSCHDVPYSADLTTVAKRCFILTCTLNCLLREVNTQVEVQRINDIWNFAGFVDANADLDCEVVFHPSFMAPDEGLFALQVHGGSTLKLKCRAKVRVQSDHHWCLKDTYVINKVCFQKLSICAEWIAMNCNYRHNVDVTSWGHIQECSHYAGMQCELHIYLEHQCKII